MEGFGNMTVNHAVTSTADSNTAPAPSDHEITIQNCNSIDEAHITLRRHALNIKYGPNGTGKSTIARALVLSHDGPDALRDLLPFKHRTGDSEIRPSVAGAEWITSTLVFDENYVSQFVFQPDEVVKNSFEIFVKTDEYIAGVQELERIFENLKGIFVENQQLDDVIASLTELRNAFSSTKSGAIAKTSKGFKALSVGGRLTNIPKPLIGYKEFLQSPDPAGWITWQAKGREYLNLSDNCPFCARIDVDREIATAVSNQYESAAVRNMSALRLTVDKLASFFVPRKLEQLRAIMASLTPPSPEEGQFLVSLGGQIETLLAKFIALRRLSFESLRDEPDLDTALSALKIDLSLLDAIDSEQTRKLVAVFNDELDEVAKQINAIKRRVGVQKKEIARSIQQNQTEINDYLRSAGYQYKVRIESTGEAYRMILEHRDSPGHLESAGSHLSYGERNAFALVLFMHEVRSKTPDLVILDDPISSFDKTKKFAILHRLFHGKGSLRGFTTLLLTHDIEPAIDMIRTGTSGQFTAARPTVHFLRSRGGHVDESRIEPADIMTFSEVCDENIGSSTDTVIKCIYLRRRYDVHGNRSSAYDVLSSLLHCRDAPSRKGGPGELLPLNEKERAAANEEIRKDIPEFDYANVLAEMRDRERLRAKFEAAKGGYEKVQLFRIAYQLDPQSANGDPAFQKFVNESYHIENEYVMQLNPRKFDTVPQHVVDACKEIFS